MNGGGGASMVSSYLFVDFVSLPTTPICREWRCLTSVMAVYHQQFGVRPSLKRGWGQYMDPKYGLVGVVQLYNLPRPTRTRHHHENTGLMHSCASNSCFDGCRVVAGVRGCLSVFRNSQDIRPCSRIWVWWVVQLLTHAITIKARI